MMPILFRCFLPVRIFLLLLGFGSAVEAAQCDYLPPKPAPDWVNNDPSIAGYYVGIGVAADNREGFDKQKDEARKNALADLSGNIEVSIKTAYTEEQKLRVRGGSEEFDKNIQSVTELASVITLRNVEVDDVWLNRHACMLWMRVKVKTSVVDAIRDRNRQQEKLAELERHLAGASGQAALEDRKRNIELAQLLFSEINFAVLEGSRGRDYFAKVMDDVLAGIQAESTQKETAESLFRDAERNLEQARLAASPQAASELNRSASAALNRILSEFSYNDRELWAEQAASRLGEIERAKGNDCGARYYYLNLQDNTRYADWRQKAQGLLIGLMCDQEKMQEFKWRKMFDGQKVIAICGYALGNRAAEWTNVCDLVRSRLSRYGAILVDVQVDDKMLLDIARQGSRSAVLKKLDPQARKVVMAATGSIGTRPSARQQGVEEYQFKGDVITFISSGERLDFSDKYSGVGGWNPVSRDMAMEVLGIHAERRWFDKVSGSL